MNMEVYGVPKEDSVQFVKCMAAIARADGQIVDEERVAIESAMQAWGIDGEDAEAVRNVLEEGGDVISFVQQFSEPRTAYLLIQELITLANIDGEYDEREKLAIYEIAKATGVSEERVEAIERWVDTGMQWRQEGQQLLVPEV